MLECFQTCVAVNKKKLKKMFAVSLFSLSVVACSTIPQTNDITGDSNLSSASYLAYAQKTDGAERTDWNILAAKAMVAQKQYDQAQEQLNQLEKVDLTQLQRNEAKLTLADLYYKKNMLVKAQDALTSVVVVNINIAQAAHYLELKSRIAESQRSYVVAVQDRLELDQYLKNNKKQANWQKVWDDLYSITDVDKMDKLSRDPILDGWLDLVNMYKRFSHRKARLQMAQRSWLAAHSTHPANLYPSRQMQFLENQDVSQSMHIALLLPLSGPASVFGHAVKDGFMENFLAQKDADDKTQLYVYDTNADSMDMLYQKLDQAQIDLIVGPLLKSSLQSLITINAGQLPMLALNLPSNNELNTNNVCFYSLSPEQEAEQMATYLVEQGKTHPVVFGEYQRLNNRMAKAFQEKWLALTGEKVSIYMHANIAELQRNVSAAFNKNTINRIESSLNVKNRRRLTQNQKNVAQSSLPDAVYLLGNARSSASVKPFIDVVANPAVTHVVYYGTSYLYEKTGHKYDELKDVIYNNMPIFTNKMSSENKEQEKRSTQYLTLYAMGEDAYSLMDNIEQLKMNPDYQLDGLTGTLSVDNHCVVHRKLKWMRYGEEQSQAILSDTDSKSTGKEE